MSRGFRTCLPSVAGETRTSAALRITVLALALFGRGEAAFAEARERAVTLYLARISSETGWEDVLANPIGSDYVDSYLIVAALSKTYCDLRGGRLQFEAEGQVAYHCGDQNLWEFNVVPALARWRQTSWSRSLASSLAFGLGLSYATEVPRIEVELEGESKQLLVYWVAEATAGPREGPWAVSLRLHHRSGGYGLVSEEGGMNALGLGVRWRF